LGQIELAILKMYDAGKERGKKKGPVRKLGRRRGGKERWGTGAAIAQILDSKAIDSAFKRGPHQGLGRRWP